MADNSTASAHVCRTMRTGHPVPITFRYARLPALFMASQYLFGAFNLSNWPSWVRVDKFTMMVHTVNWRLPGITIPEIVRIYLTLAEISQSPADHIWKCAGWHILSLMRYITFWAQMYFFSSDLSFYFIPLLPISQPRPDPGTQHIIFPYTTP